MNRIADQVSSIRLSPGATGRLLNPASILIAGASARPGTLGHRVLNNLLNSGYQGTIYLTGRQRGTILGLDCVTSLDEVPRGIDLALLTLPSGSIRETVRECGRRGFGAVVCFASGFAEVGDEGRGEENALAADAEESGIGVIGPNCFGFLNQVENVYALLTAIPAMPAPDGSERSAAAVIAQSGGMGGCVANSLGGRGIPISYLVTTGNEVGLGIPELIDYLAEDFSTGPIAVYAEQIRRPADFMAAVHRARARRKAVVMMHPGRNVRSQAALQSHTGALTTDHAVMAALARRCGVALVDTMEELIDLTHLLLRYPEPPTAGVGVITLSGAICAITADAVDDLELDMPDLTPALGTALAAELAFTSVHNPLDLGTQPIARPDLVKMSVELMGDDPAVGSILVSLPDSGERLDLAWLDSAVEGAVSVRKPMIYVTQNESSPPPDFVAKVLANRVVFHRSPERALRLLASATRYGQDLAIEASDRPPADHADAARLSPGLHPEWRSKQILRSVGVPVPSGSLAQSVDGAIAIAEGLGYPVALKVQSVDLPHKSDIGGVALGVADAGDLTRAWEELQAAVAKAGDPASLDGVLVEAMSVKGVELVVGARRDAKWGPAVLIGSGGVLVEALEDVRILPTDLPHDAIVTEIGKLRGARLLQGFRGAPPADLNAVATVVALVGQLMTTHPEIVEIDINPLMVYRAGDGAMALDALIVTN
jgi:acyl-CoA synthetase (NDP forming)